MEIRLEFRWPKGRKDGETYRERGEETNQPSGKAELAIPPKCREEKIWTDPYTIQITVFLDFLHIVSMLYFLGYGEPHKNWKKENEANSLSTTFSLLGKLKVDREEEVENGCSQRETREEGRDHSQ